MNNPATNEEAPSRVQQVREKAQETFEQAREQATEAMHRGEEYVRENPIPVIAGAFLLGTLIGILLARRDEDTFRHRYWDEPLESGRNLFGSLGSSFNSAMKKVGDFDARDHAETALSEARKAGRKLKFW